MGYLDFFYRKWRREVLEESGIENLQEPHPLGRSAFSQPCEIAFVAENVNQFPSMLLCRGEGSPK